jgi:serine/threonine protein kinase
MGEVYRARDTRLDRIVAVKVSKENFSERFEREARAVAALNHPHICTLYDVGPNYLVMEYIEGSPLKGPVPLDQALRHAAQICDALDAAHSKGLTHRDLKPGNILLTKSGVKLLDFGLAKRKPIAGADDKTLTLPLTGAGQIVGTLFYMSPEQLQGKEVGPESDIFSFGLVLYELLTGKRAFDGKNSASVIAAILERPAPSVADIAPAALDRVLRKCLAKDPERRWQSARDLRMELEWIGTTSEEASSKYRRSAPLVIALAIVSLLAAGLGYIAYRHTTEEAPRVLKVSVLPPEKATSARPSVSPDGKSIAFSTISGNITQIWVRDLDSLSAHPLPGTEHQSQGAPLWSPDGRRLSFLAGGKLKSVEVTGGPALEICPVSSYIGGSWGKDYIVFGTATGIVRVPQSGGVPTPITVPPPGNLNGNPWFLPDGRHFLYGEGTLLADQAIYVADVESTDPAKNRRKVLAGAAAVAYSQNRILFLRGGTLMAQRFDTGSLEVSGDAEAVAENVDSIGGVASYGVSQNGVLAYMSGGQGNLQLTWYDRAGKPLRTVGTPGFGFTAALSPDDMTVAFERLNQTSGDGVLLLDARGGESRITSGGGFNAYPIWSSDGSQIAYYSLRGGIGSTYVKPRNGIGKEQPIRQVPGFDFPADWSPDGRIIMSVNAPKTKFDIWVAPTSGDGEPFPYLDSEFNERAAKLSPNGQWLAYVSDENNRNDVYLQSFPKRGGEIPVSTSGGDLPIWSRDGTELFYISADMKMTAVDIKRTGNVMQAGVPKTLFPVRIGPSLGHGYAYDVSKDGNFLIPTPVQPSGGVPFTVLVNWTAGLKK